jgi:hypothetical protein
MHEGDRERCSPKAAADRNRMTTEPGDRPVSASIDDTDERFRVAAL